MSDLTTQLGGELTQEIYTPLGDVDVFEKVSADGYTGSVESSLENYWETYSG